MNWTALKVTETLTSPRMDSDSGDVDGVGCGGAGGGLGAGGIGAGGLNPYKHVAADIRKERLPPQDDLPPPPLRGFADGSQLLFNWHICWALVLGGILQFVYNKDRGDTNLYKELDVEGFADKVKLGNKRFEPMKKVGASSMSVGSLKNAMAHGYFRPVKGATPETITRLLETKGPIGFTLDFITPLADLRDGIYRVPKPIDGIKRHVVMIVAHGLTLEREIFFEVQNTWGTDWGVNGHGRIIISGSTDDVFLPG
ncbi:hypothetical protein HID58_050804 [Brassica napus]|uniref:Peptidase C1A papain C-terminal domain-containing protein n=1 Tax=Brassica napus TaxID=3708 RepID=A0ABQ8A763_BRANA|nr:hypothetical protein HID58_050804 [Brassica napus]